MQWFGMNYQSLLVYFDKKNLPPLAVSVMLFCVKESWISQITIINLQIAH